MTGEAVPLELRLAKLPSRALAILIDFAVLALVGVVIFLIISQVVPDVDEALAAALTVAGVVVLLVGVPTTVETLTRGRSLGKLALGLRAVRDDGGPVRFRHALVRALAGVFVDFILTSGAGAVICSIANEKGKRVGDLLAGTVVIRERIPATTTALPPVPPYLASWATGVEMSRLPTSVALAARSYLTRLPQLDPHVRDRLGSELATQIAGFVSPKAPAGTPAWAYLSAVLGERHRREALRLAAEHAAPGPPAGRPTPPSPMPTPPSWPSEHPSPGGLTPPS